MLFSIAILIAGIILLVQGARYFVDGSASLAKFLRVSGLVIGLTVVALGTSAPELVVNAFASIKDKGDIAIGTILGSNISNTLLMLGIAAMITSLRVQLSTVWKEIPFSLLAVLVLGVVVNDIWFADQAAATISRGDGMICIFFFVIFIYYIYAIGKSGRAGQEIEEVRRHNKRKTFMMVLGGMAMLLVGGNITVDAAADLAQYLGISDTLIGLTVVAIGTSLPELAAVALAAYRKHVDMAVGTIVGSNIFNIFLVLGVSSVIRPMDVKPILNFDILILIAVTLVLFASMFVGERRMIKRWQGLTFVIAYIIYFAFIVWRG